MRRSAQRDARTVLQRGFAAGLVTSHMPRPAERSAAASARVSEREHNEEGDAKDGSKPTLAARKHRGTALWYTVHYTIGRSLSPPTETAATSAPRGLAFGSVCPRSALPLPPRRVPTLAACMSQSVRRHRRRASTRQPAVIMALIV